MAEKVLISFEVDNSGAISKITQTKRAIGEEIPAATQKAETGFGRLTRTLAAVGTAFAAIGVARLARSLVDIGGQVIRTGAQFETMAIQMRAVTGSADAAAEAMDWIVQFTADTPYQLEQVTDAFVRMRAMGLDPMDGTMQAVADMTSYLGGSMETMNSIVLALGKSFTVGKMSMEELRMLAERGVPVFDILADKLGVTNQQIVEMSAKGQLGRDAIQLLIEGMGELAGGASQNLMESFTGLWSNLQDQITLAMKELSEGGALDGAKEGLRSLLNVAIELRESGKLEEWGHQLGEIFNTVANVLATAIDNFGAFLQAYYLFTGGLWNATSKIAAIQEWYVRLAQSMVLSPEARRSMEDFANTLGDLSEGAAQFAQQAADNFAGFKGQIREVNTELPKTTTNVKAASEAMDDLAASTGEATTFTELLEEATKRAGAETPKWARALTENIDKIDKLTTSSITATSAIKEIADESSVAADAMMNSFTDLISKGFTGELESFADIWENIWADLAKSMTTILGGAIEDAFKGGGSIFNNIKDAWGGIKEAVGANRVGAGLAGAGMVYSGYQQGGAGGALQGALGGAMAGFSVGGPWGALVGGILGGAMSFLGGEDPTRYRVNVGMGGGYQTRLSGPGASSEARHAQLMEMVAQYRASVMAMNSVLRLFEDGDLFGLIREAPDFNFEGEAKFDEIAAIFREQWLPTAMRQMFRRAINRGLRNFGVDETTRRQLWSEITALTGSDQIAGLETYISALVNTSHLLDDMDWNVITDETRMNSMERFFAGMDDVLEAVQNSMLGVDQMTLLERAGQADTINQLILQARQAEIQMLQQIDQIQQGINRSIDSQIESIRTGGMSEGQLQDYYLQQIESIMNRLREGVSSPEAIQQLMADLQRYTGAYQSLMGDSLYNQSIFGGSEADWIIGILEEARGLSNEAFEEMRDQIRETNQALIEELQRLIEALTNYGDSIATADQAGPVPQFDGNIGIDINVTPSEWFETWVDARVNRAVITYVEQQNGPY